jgi:hypothetical protein
MTWHIGEGYSRSDRIMNDEQTAIHQLAQTLALHPIEVDHQTVTSQLTDYVAAQLAGQDYRVQFDRVARHLDTCIECAEAYNLLYELAVAESSQQVALPAHWGKPDLTFLAPPAATVVLAQVRAAIQRFGERLRLQLTPDLLVALRPAFTPATTRGAGEDQRYGELLLRLELPDELALDWRASLVVYRDAQHPEDALVEVTVEPAGRSWPDLEGIAVTLATGEGEQTAVSDAWGLATFERVPIASLEGMRIWF